MAGEQLTDSEIARIRDIFHRLNSIEISLRETRAELLKWALEKKIS